MAYVDPSVMFRTVQAIVGVAIALCVVSRKVWRGSGMAPGERRKRGKEV